MALTIPAEFYAQITAHLEAAYPNEGAGLLLGEVSPSGKQVRMILILNNKFDADEQYHRYLISAEDMVAGEDMADEHGLDVVGVFHSHPDHPAKPSEFDRENALPWYSYLIVSVLNGKAATHRSWLLNDDRSRFSEETLQISA